MAMSQPPRPRTDHLVTDDDEPVDIFTGKQMRLLTSPLYGGWKPGRPFIAAANVGLFMVAKNPAIVPDVFVSLDVEMPPLTGPDRARAYFVWEFGKVPDIVIEIVSDTVSGELSEKLRAYERMRVSHYVVFDPNHLLGTRSLTTFSLDGGAYTERGVPRFVAEGLALVQWEGAFERSNALWLRWTDLDGRLFRTPEEAHARADAARARADAEQARAEAALAKLRALGVEP